MSASYTDYERKSQYRVPVYSREDRARTITPIEVEAEGPFEARTLAIIEAVRRGIPRPAADEPRTIARVLTRAEQLAAHKIKSIPRCRKCWAEMHVKCEKGYCSVCWPEMSALYACSEPGCDEILRTPATRARFCRTHQKGHGSNLRKLGTASERVA